MTTTPAPLLRRAVGTRTGGVALLIGVLIFIGSRFRHLVDPSDRLLGVLMLTAFVAWFVGLLALRAQYRPRANALGRFGLATSLVGIGLLTVGHVGAFLLELAGPWFMPIVMGTLVLVIGVATFGLDALRGGVLPRWRAVPAIAGAVGLLWILFASDSRPVEGNPEAFIAMRTAFGACWLPLAYVLFTDRRDTTDRTQGPRDSRDPLDRPAGAGKPAPATRRVRVERTS